jgi:NAD(P)-dependent dehydrogenase (short-subunit alcohol dehydrogenase family)
MLADAPIDDRYSPTAIVTGGSNGIGKAICELLARDGFLVAVADRDEVRARAVADACGGVALALDVTDETSVSTMFARAFDALGGRIDALATAAIEASTLGAGHEPQDFQRLHAVVVLGTYLCIREAAGRMATGARICTVAPMSTGIGAGGPLGMPYASVRGALAAMTQDAARAFVPQGIAVNGVAPGARGSEQELAGVVAFLLSQRAAALNGQMLTTGDPY